MSVSIDYVTGIASIICKTTHTLQPNGPGQFQSSGGHCNRPSWTSTTSRTLSGARLNAFLAFLGNL